MKNILNQELEKILNKNPGTFQETIEKLPLNLMVIWFKLNKPIVNHTFKTNMKTIDRYNFFRSIWEKQLELEVIHKLFVLLEKQLILLDKKN